MKKIKHCRKTYYISKNDMEETYILFAKGFVSLIENCEFVQLKNDEVTDKEIEHILNFDLVGVPDSSFNVENGRTYLVGDSVLNLDIETAAHSVYESLIESKRRSAL